MNRRHVLRGLATSGFAACPACIALAETAARPKWSYEGATGPQRWNTLDGTYAACGTGSQQSPIDIAGSIRAELAPLEFSYGEITAAVENNGHTIEVPVPPGHVLRVSGADFTLLQFHFHAPSEHRTGGRAFPMEAHFVHSGSAGELAVVAVMLAEGAANPAWAPVFDGIPEGAPSGEAQISLPALLPDERSYYLYAGSLTTPSCSEIVTWLVLHQPVGLAASQISRFTSIFPDNARPLQPANRRFILRSF
jgi:carbonic anhydrase